MLHNWVGCLQSKFCSQIDYAIWIFLVNYAVIDAFECAMGKLTRGVGGREVSFVVTLGDMDPPTKLHKGGASEGDMTWVGIGS